MKTVILCGGYGTRLSEETYNRPKPLIEIGDKPILWHIMKNYSSFGFNEFLLATGYKGEKIKEYFIKECFDLDEDLALIFNAKQMLPIRQHPNNWIADIIDTGEGTMTGGRLYRLRDKLKGDQTFMLTYGDGVGDIDINKLIAYHKSRGKIATITAVKPTARFGEIQFKGEEVVSFKEKPNISLGWINGGFFVFEKKIFDYISGDEIMLEGEPLENLAKDGELTAYKHDGFWKCMDTLRDKKELERLWTSGSSPWKVWK
ncbi:MAG: glucose-1-phosphate cytidylyltransferase [bacterium]